MKVIHPHIANFIPIPHIKHKKNENENVSIEKNKLYKNVANKITLNYAMWQEKSCRGAKSREQNL